MKAILVLVALVALAGCADGRQADSESPPSGIPQDLSTPTKSPPRPTSTEPALNADAVGKGKALLRGIGVQDVAEGEHGFRSASLSGTWGEYDVFAFVTPPEVPPAWGRVVSKRHIGGLPVTTVRLARMPLRVRFVHDRFTIDLQVFDGDYDEISLGITNALVDGLLWPQ